MVLQTFSVSGLRLTYRLGLNYAITDRLMIGAGTAKNYRAQDLALKYALLQADIVPVRCPFL